MIINSTQEYNMILEYYANKYTSKNIPYINHIHEGLTILDKINSTFEAKRAYCLHPMYQANQDLINNKLFITYLDPYIIFLIMEYRNIANGYLSKDVNIKQPKLSPVDEVNQMLIADKVQNYKDFLLYNQDRYNASILYQYFQNWFDILEINYNQLVKYII